MASLATHRRRRTSGMATVEMALVLTLLVLFLFGIMEFGWMFFRIQQVSNAAREGVRQAVLPDADDSRVQDRVATVMSGWGLAGSYTLTISPENVEDLEPGELITVTVEVPYSAVSLTNIAGDWEPPDNLHATATMAKEGP